MQLQKGDALIVVDMQNDFVTGSLAVPGASDIIHNVVEMVERFKSKNLPIYFTACSHPQDHCSFQAQGGPWPRHCVNHTQGADFVEPLNTMLTNTDWWSLVKKGWKKDEDAYSGFRGTDLQQKLQATGVNRLFVCGLATDYCVKETVLDGLKLNYTVVLLGDAIAAVNAKPGDGSRARQEMYKGPPGYSGALARDT